MGIDYFLEVTLQGEEPLSFVPIGIVIRKSLGNIYAGN
jgi:hypothetical protein